MRLQKNALFVTALFASLDSSAAELESQYLPLSSLLNKNISEINTRINGEDVAGFQESGKGDKTTIDDQLYKGYKSTFNTFQEREVTLNDLSLKLDYKRKIITEIADAFIEKDGYFFLPRETELQNLLPNKYNFIALYDLLNSDLNWASGLFEELFNKKMPSENTEQALNLLSACLPMTHLYVREKGYDPFSVTSAFKEQHHKSFLKALHDLKDKNNYFLVGIDEDWSRLCTAPHFIVANQSDQDMLDNIKHYKTPEFPSHTIIYNADQKILNLKGRKSHSETIIVTNGNLRCTEIGDEFLMDDIDMSFLTLQGLNRLEIIGGAFLANCRYMTSFKHFGLNRLEKVGNCFLYECNQLKNFNTIGLSGLKSIGNDPLSHCHGLLSFDSEGLTSVESIGGHFLYDCRGLITFDSRGLSNLKLIEGKFLSGCKNLKLFDSRGLTGVERIKDYFLQFCDALTCLDARGFTSLKYVGACFIGDCPNFDSSKVIGLDIFEAMGITIRAKRELPAPADENNKSNLFNFLARILSIFK